MVNKKLSKVNKERIKLYIKLYLAALNDILLWVFIISMVSIAVVYMFNIDKLNFEIQDPANIIKVYDGDNFYLNSSSVTVITQEEWDDLSSFYRAKFWLALFLLIGWCFVHPRLYKNIWRFIKNVEM